MAPHETAHRLLRAWRTHLRNSFAKPVTLDVTHPSGRMGDPLRHCGEISVLMHGPIDAAVGANRLGELLRVMALTTAPHVDASLFNALWEPHGLCPIGVSLCVRCDAVDRHQAAVVHLSIVTQGQGTRSGVGLLHDAIYNWDETTDASAEFTQVREALERPEDDTTQTTPTVDLVLIIGRFTDVDELQVRDLEALLARNAAEDDATRRFRITRVLPHGGGVQTTSPQFAPLFQTIVAADVSTNLEFVQGYALEMPDPWQWLCDWAARTSGPPLCVGRMTILFDGQMALDTLIKLAKIVATRCGPLDHLTLTWPLQLTKDDAAQRRCALEALGAALFAPNSRAQIQTLALDLGELTNDDVAALSHGSRGGEADARVGGDDVGPRIHALVWNAQATAEDVICQVAPLFAAVGVQELEINAWNRRLSCHSLKSVLQGCPELTKLNWWTLDCGDLTELTDATWSSDGSRLRALRVMAIHGDNAAFVSAVDALLARVGSQMKSLAVFAHHSALSGPLADVIVARCPQLRELEVGHADAAFHDHFVCALNEGRCRVTNFTTYAGPAAPGNVWGALLDALMEARSGVTQNLRQLKLHASRMRSSSRKAVAQAVLKSFSTNSTLQRAAFVSDLSNADRAQFRVLSRQFVARGPSKRRRLALLSVIQAKGLAEMPPDVLNAVFEFAGRPIRRYAY